MSSEKQLKEIDLLRKYLLKCPDLEASCCAMQSCLKALEAHREKIVRDEKLKLKFSESSAPFSGKFAASSTCDTSAVIVERERKRPVICNDAVEEDWQDVACSSSPRPSHSSADLSTMLVDEEDDSDGVSGNGKVQEAGNSIARSLSQSAVSGLANAQAVVHSPLSLLAVVFHSALRSAILDFQCTGIPPTSKEAAGFAPTIRALPKNIFLPKDWEAYSTACAIEENGTVTSLGHINLRYRKQDIQGPMVLHVALLPRFGDTAEILPSLLSKYMNRSNGKAFFAWEKMSVADLEKLQVQVTFGPPKSNGTVQTDDLTNAWTFPLGTHANLASFTAAHRTASKSTAAISPSLHFKSLPALFSTFLGKFDLGSIQDCNSIESTNLYLNKVAQDMVQQTLNNAPDAASLNSMALRVEVEARARPTCSIPPSSSSNPKFSDPLRISAVRPSPFESTKEKTCSAEGDFAQDLVPSGINPFPNNLMPSSSGRGGNLMGPHHSAFKGGFANNEQIDDPGPELAFGGLGMRPRFDPFGPPGGPTEPRQTRGGNPNPDHMRPPNNLGSHMFM